MKRNDTEFARFRRIMDALHAEQKQKKSAPAPSKKDKKKKQETFSGGIGRRIVQVDCDTTSTTRAEPQIGVKMTRELNSGSHVR